MSAEPAPLIPRVKDLLGVTSKQADALVSRLRGEGRIGRRGPYRRPTDRPSRDELVAIISGHPRHRQSQAVAVHVGVSVERAREWLWGHRIVEVHGERICEVASRAVMCGVSPVEAVAVEFVWSLTTAERLIVLARAYGWDVPYAYRSAPAPAPVREVREIGLACSECEWFVFPPDLVGLAVHTDRVHRRRVLRVERVPVSRPTNNIGHTPCKHD
jgi:hypothetical protein